MLVAVDDRDAPIGFVAVGASSDGDERVEDLAGTTVRELRYRRAL